MKKVKNRIIVLTFQIGVNVIGLPEYCKHIFQSFAITSLFTKKMQKTKTTFNQFNHL